MYQIEFFSVGEGGGGQRGQKPPYKFGFLLLIIVYVHVHLYIMYVLLATILVNNFFLLPPPNTPTQCISPP